MRKKKNVQFQRWRPTELDEAVKKEVNGREMQEERSSKDL